MIPAPTVHECVQQLITFLACCNWFTRTYFARWNGELIEQTNESSLSSLQQVSSPDLHVTFICSNGNLLAFIHEIEAWLHQSVTKLRLCMLAQRRLRTSFSAHNSKCFLADQRRFLKSPRAVLREPGCAVIDSLLLCREKSTNQQITNLFSFHTLLQNVTSALRFAR